MAGVTSASHPFTTPSFNPQDMVAIPIGCMTANLYPCIQPLMVVSKCALGLHVTLSTLKVLTIPPDLNLDVLWIQLNLATIVDGLKFDFHEFF